MLSMFSRFMLLLCCTLFVRQSQSAASCVDPNGGLNLTSSSGCCNEPTCCIDDCCCDQLCYEHLDCCLDIWKLDCPRENDQPPIDSNLYTCEVVYGVQMDGCCTGSDCRLNKNQPCYCDQDCYHHQDCCVDIMDIGCKCNFTCQEHYGNISGCCVGNDCSTSCCSCDEGCYSRGDCCMNINEWGCFITIPVPEYCRENTTSYEELGNYNVTWELTESGVTVDKLCPPTKEGHISRTCAGRDEWGEVTIDCKPKGQSQIEKDLLIVDTFSPEMKVELATNISIYVINALLDPFLPNNPEQLSTIVSLTSQGIDLLLSTIGEINSTEAYFDTKYLDVFNDMFEEKFSSPFLFIGNSTGGSSDLMVAYEKLSQYAASFEVEYGSDSQSYIIQKKNLVFSNKVYTRSSSESDITFPANEDVPDFDNIFPPEIVYYQSDLSKFSGDNGKVSVVNSVIKNMHQFLSTELKGRTQIGSIILSSVVMSDMQSGRLPATLNFYTHQFYNQQPRNLKCVYWDDSKYHAGEIGWSTDGIEVLRNSTWFISDNVTQGNISCKIYHQTPFSILVDVHDIEYNPTEEYALEIVGYIGLGISIVFLILTILMLILLGKQLFLSVQYFIHFNLSIALLCGYVIFLFLIDRRIINATNSEVGCAIVAGCLQYFFTAAFAWMLCEGIMLFLLLVLVFTSISKRWYIFLFIGWGVPVIPVAISAGLIYDHYGSPGRHCWIDLNESRSAIWAFVVPILIVIVVNIFFLIMAVRALIIFHRKKADGSKEGYTVFKKTAIGTIILLPLMGTTWAIGLFAVDRNTTVFAWLFVVLNSLQGAFIFFFNIVRNEKIKENMIQKCCPKMARRKKSEAYTTRKSTLKHSDSFSYKDGNRKSQQQFLMSAPSSNMTNMFESYVDDEFPADVDDQQDVSFDDFNETSS